MTRIDSRAVIIESLQISLLYLQQQYVNSSKRYNHEIMRHDNSDVHINDKKEASDDGT